MSSIGLRVTQFARDIIHPFADDSRAHFHGQPVTHFFLFNEMCEFVYPHIFLVSQVAEPRQQRWLGENHDSAEMTESCETENIPVRVPFRLVLLIERRGVDQNFAESMVFPVMESEYWNDGTRRHQNPDGFVDFGANSGDLDLTEEDLDEVSKPRSIRFA